MSTYETDEERVEAIKKWWKENGISVITGVVIGLGAIFGWRAWTGYQDGVAQQASAAYEQLLASAGSGAREDALKQSAFLAEEYGSTAYADFAALVRARVELAAGNRDAARAALEQAIEGAPDPALARLAALRLARVLIDQDELDEAVRVLDRQGDGGAFAGEMAALRGDIAVAQGRFEDARSAYEEALEAGTANPRLVELKLDNLPPAG